ncbi:protein FMC1 homolog isoform X1 [Phocoena sinus]|uniref:protein FMC1 homolog isoform X1 n=1 Tax=Phocoena sinus TaxID=42100 RepID=UPI0013C47E89|nr:protein FMC1 homolog isoform X1 [Phocoena sinus]
MAEIERDKKKDVLGGECSVTGHSIYPTLSFPEESYSGNRILMQRGNIGRFLKSRTTPLRGMVPCRAELETFNEVTSEKLCRAQHELHFQAATYLCLLRSIREHVALHQEFHGKGERSVEESAGLVGLKLPQQPGGKGWEP